MFTRKKILLQTILFLFFFAQPGYCFLNFIFDGAKWLYNQGKEVADEVKEIAVLKNIYNSTVNTVAELKKNYESSEKFYNEMRKLQNPRGIAEEVGEDFQERLERDTVGAFWEDVDERARQKKGIYEWTTDRATEAGHYIDTHYDFGRQIAKNMKERRERTKETVEEYSSPDEKKRKQAEARTNLLLLEEIQDNNRLQLNQYELQLKIYQDQLAAQQRAFNIQQFYADAARELYKQKRKTEKEQRLSREEQIRQTLKEVPEKRYYIPEQGGNKK